MTPRHLTLDWRMFTSTQWKTTQRKKVCKRSLTLLKFSVICRQVLQALFKSFLASVTWQSKTRVKQDKRRSSRSSGPVDSISADQFTQFHIRRRALQPLARKLSTDVKVLQRSDTSMRGVPNIRWKIALSMQSVTKWYLHAGYMEKKKPWSGSSFPRQRLNRIVACGDWL